MARRRKKSGPYWKEPAVICATVAAIILLAAAAAAMLHFSKPRSQRVRKVVAVPRLEYPPTVHIDGQEVNLDTLEAQSYSDLLAQLSDQPEALEQIEHALARSLQQGREKASIANLPPAGDYTTIYPSRLRGRLEKLALLGAARGTLRPRTYMELGLFEYYREKNAQSEDVGENVALSPFGEAYAALGLTENPQGGYSAAVFFFTKAIKGSDPKDRWREMERRRATALADIALVLWAWGDRAGAMDLFEEAIVNFRAQHSPGQVAKMRQYMDALADEGPAPDAPLSAVAVEIKEKLQSPQNMP